MATVISAPVSPTPNSESSANQPSSALVFQGEDATMNGALSVVKEQSEPPISMGKEEHVIDKQFSLLDSKEYKDKCRKIEADYTVYLTAKYFSEKDIFGGKIYENTVELEGETIKTSRFHCALSYADPKKYSEVQNGRRSTEAPDVKNELLEEQNRQMPVEASTKVTNDLSEKQNMPRSAEASTEVKDEVSEVKNICQLVEALPEVKNEHLEDQNRRSSADGSTEVKNEPTPSVKEE